MNERILLASYAVRIKHKREDAYLSAFNDVDDFYNLLKKFFNYIFTNVNQLKDRLGNETIHLTLDELPIFDDSKRIFYGYFSSGVSGDNYKIKEISSNTTLLDVDKKNHASFRNVFFYFYIPKNKKIGYLILQRKTHFGIKTKLDPALNGFLAKEGYMQNYLELKNIIHVSVYNHMMKFGKLKKVELVKNRIPNSLEDYMNNNQNYEEAKGSFRTSFSSRTSLPSHWKSYIDKLLRKELNETVEIDGLDDSFSDLEFQLDLNGKQKTFYIKNRHKVQPDVDVTNNIDFENEIPKIESLVKNAQELIDDIIKLVPKNA
ncbi:hypothetical protein [Chryseobacterium bernardetii]|uniref:hypothetical protein n=1 Tax=Chryseobacterium bernardetii TaxID=1241978 RepID=UPI000F5029C1|nr:hypothetical protein [Chryseobacterium bernardetii]AZB33768.1 hypothetical protein EG351_09180 [Chryseobacterium bernardetii]